MMPAYILISTRNSGEKSCGQLILVFTNVLFPYIYTYILSNDMRAHKSIIEAVAELEKLGFTPYLLAAPGYNKQTLKGRVSQVKEILCTFSYPYNRKIAGQHGHFTMRDYQKWLKKAETEDLSRALRRLAQLNQSKVYLFWKNSARD